MKKMKKFFAFSLAFIIALGVYFSYDNCQSPNIISARAADTETEITGFMDTLIFDREYIVYHSESGKTHMFDGRSVEDYLDFMELFDYENYEILDISITTSAGKGWGSTNFFVTFQNK